MKRKLENQTRRAWEMDIDEIYRAYFAQVYRYTLLLTRDQAEAEDVTQETFFKAIRHINGFRGETDIRIWLCRIAKNIFLDRKRKQKRTVPLDQADEIPAVHDPERDIVLKDSASYAMEALARLPELYRTVFTMRTIRTALSSGMPVICSMYPRDFTTSGHFIVLAGPHTDGNVIVRDPNSRINSEKVWSISRLLPQIHAMWEYSVS